MKLKQSNNKKKACKAIHELSLPFYFMSEKKTLNLSRFLSFFFPSLPLCLNQKLFKTTKSSIQLNVWDKSLPLTFMHVLLHASLLVPWPAGSPQFGEMRVELAYTGKCTECVASSTAKQETIIIIIKMNERRRK